MFGWIIKVVWSSLAIQMGWSILDILLCKGCKQLIPENIENE